MKTNIKYLNRLRPCLEEVENEVLTAKEKYPSDFNSTHEGLAVLEEEFLELRDEIFWGEKRHKKEMSENGASITHKSQMRNEARQIAAMALRIMAELT